VRAHLSLRARPEAKHEYTAEKMVRTPGRLGKRIRELPTIDFGTVAEHQIDLNGHVNIRVFFDILTSATINYCDEFDLGLSYQNRAAMGLFSVDHRIRYIRELRLGEGFSVHVILLQASDRGLHTMTYMVNVAGIVTTTLETVFLNVDLVSRRVAPFSESAQQQLRGVRASTPEWAVSVGGEDLMLPGRVLAPPTGRSR
jgi:acyl-CoA thioester hydrolase